MPLLGLGEQRLHPDLPLADRFLIGLRGMVAPHLVQVGLVDRTLDGPAAVAGRASLLDRTGVADRRVSSVDDDVLGPLAAREGQRVASRAAIPVPLRVVSELV